MGKLKNIMSQEQVSRLSKREHLRELIGRISILYGGDTQQELNQFIDETLENWNEKIDYAIECFEDIANPTKIK